MIDTPEGPRPRINIITWGRETGTNAYSHSRHTMFAGVLYRDQLDLGAETIAASRSYVSQRNLDRLQEISDSETAQAIYQAASRSAIRYQRDGQAAGGTIWLPLKTPRVLDVLRRDAFPGIKMVRWQSSSSDWRARSSKKDECAAAMAAILESLPSDVETISGKRLRSLLSAPVSNKVWKAATNSLAEYPPDGWQRSGRSWVRV